MVIPVRRFLALAALLLGQPARAQVLTPELAISRRLPSGLEVSPDGKKVAFVVQEPPSGSEVRRHVYQYRADSDSIRQLTTSSKSEWEPKWSPDGRWLAFISDRVDRPQLWLLPLDGGEAQQLTMAKAAVQRFSWSPDSRSIAFTAPPPATDDEEKKSKDKDDARVVDRDDKPTALWLVDVATKSVRQLTRAPWAVDELAWMPSGDRVVLLATDHPDPDRWTDAIYLLSLGDSVPRLLASPRGSIGELQVAPGGRLISYLAARIDGPIPHDLFLQPVDGGAARNLTGGTLDRPIDNYRWRSDSTIQVEVADGFTIRLETLGVNGRSTASASLPVSPRSVVALADGSIVFVGQSAVRQPELWRAAPGGGSARSVSSFNAKWNGVSLVTPELLKYPSFDRVMVEGALLLPRDRRPDQRVPLVVLVHGGPTGAWQDGFEPWGQLLVAKGYAVFYPNVRGSTGYGWNFLVANRGDWGGGDFKDVMAGVDYLVARGIVDPDRLGIGGWSYGGYLSSWAITQTTRFKAAVTGAGMSDLATEYGTEAGPAYDEWFYGLPYEKPDGFRKSSPISYIARAKTPTLILQGEADVTDPISQSQMLYRALKRYQVPTELVLYPREGHGLREEKHLVDRLRRIVAWFDRWLL